MKQLEHNLKPKAVWHDYSFSADFLGATLEPE
jgi:hypothetical protein